MNPQSTQASPALVSDVLDRNTEVAQELRVAAMELEVVHAVLTVKSDGKELDGEAKEAIRRTEEVEQRLVAAADTLDESNDVLREIAESGTDAPAQYSLPVRVAPCGTT